MLLFLGRRVVKIGVEVILCGDAFRFHALAEPRQSLRRTPDFVEGRRAERIYTKTNFVDQVGNPGVEKLSQPFVDGESGRGGGKLRARGVVKTTKEGYRIENLIERQNPRIQSIVEIGREIGDLVRRVDQLRFERRKAVEKIFGQLGMLTARVIARVFYDAFADGEGKIKAAICRITFFKPSDDAQRVQVVVKAEAVLAQGVIERLLPGMAEGRMPNVVRQAQSLRQLNIKPQRPSDSERDLGHLKGMCQAAAEVVGKALCGQT